MSIIQGTSKTSAAGAGYTIDQSIRFNDNDTAYLDNTSYSGSPTSGTDCTFSFWVKRCNLSTTQCLFFGGNPSGSTWEIIRFESDNQFRVGQASSAYDLTTSQVFRDVGAWSHFVVAFDTDNGTAADRIKIYHNGSRITDFSLETNPSSGYVTNFNTGGAGEFIRIGYQGGGSNPSDVYLAEINFVDGQALDPTSFGETNADTGQWVPVSYTGSYGTNGFYITGADSADLGADDSGNGNDFTSSGLAAADQVTDSPTDNFPTLNSTFDYYTTGNTSYFRPNFAVSLLSEGNLKIDFNSPNTPLVYSTATFPSSGKFYFEVTADIASGGGMGIGGSNTIEDGIGSSAVTGMSNCIIYYSNGNLYNQSSTQSSYGNATAIANGEYVGVAVDIDNDAIWFCDNGTWVDGDGTDSSATVLAEIEAGTTTSAAATNFLADQNSWHPMVAAVGDYPTYTTNFGQSSFTGTAPAGFTNLSTANLPDPTIADPGDYFNTVLFTGNSGTAFSVTGVGFQPDFVWGKPRSYADNHRLMDVVRGSTKQILSNSTGAEFTQAQGITSFDSDGFTVGTHNGLNTGTNTYVAWNWLADNTTGSSNTDGDITSTVSANTTSGFSIVNYSGNGSDNQTIGHGLGIAPKMIISKRLDTTGGWTTYHDAVGINKVFYLNSTAAPASNTEQYRAVPTSSVYTVGVGGDINNASGTYVAYVFAEVEGFSKFGSYTGNGSTDGPFIYTGFKPRFVMIKRYTSTESWPILDTARGSGNFGSDAGSGGDNPTAGNDLNAVLVASTTAAEEDNPTGSRRASYVSNGFKVRTTNTAMNGSGSGYIYMAFAESPFKTATAR